MVEGVTWWLEILQKLFGSEVVGWIVLILSPFIFIYALLWLIQAIIELVKTKFIPLLYNSEEKQKIRLRKRFADHIESERRILIIAFGIALGLCSVIFGLKFVYNSNVGEIIVSIVTLFGFLYMIYTSITKTILTDNRYRSVWREWRDSTKDVVEIEEVIRILPLISTRHAYNLFEKVRIEKLFLYTKENLHFLLELIRLVENPDIENEFSDALEEFLLHVYDNKLKSLLLDELFKSIQEMQYKFQGN